MAGDDLAVHIRAVEALVADGHVDVHDGQRSGIGVDPVAAITPAAVFARDDNGAGGDLGVVGTQPANGSDGHRDQDYDCIQRSLQGVRIAGCDQSREY